MTICNAIRGRCLLEFTYHGYHRVVEPHTFGRDRKGHLALRAYQVGGESKSGNSTEWKIFHANDMRGTKTLSDKFPSPRADYKRGDKAFIHIECQL